MIIRTAGAIAGAEILTAYAKVYDGFSTLTIVAHGEDVRGQEVKVEMDTIHFRRQDHAERAMAYADRINDRLRVVRHPAPALEAAE